MTADEQIASAYDFSPSHTLIALGAESASLFATILKNHPHLMGVLFDQAAALEAARVILAEAGVEQHCDVIAGDYFEDVPLWGDFYLLAHLLSRWSDEQSITVLRHCHQSMHPDGRVLVVEEVAAAAEQTRVPEQGRTRSEQEYRLLLQAARLHLARVLPTGTLLSILEAPPHKQAAL